MHVQPNTSSPSSTRSPRSSTTVLRDGWIAYRADHLANLSQAELRDLARSHTPHVLDTAFGNLNKVSRNKARMAKHTYIITDGSADAWSHKTISRDEANALIEAQRTYIEDKGKLLEVQGWLGVGDRAVPVQWLYTMEGANIAGMQSVLSFPRERVEGTDDGPFHARYRVVYTPNFRPDVPGGQRILVDLDNLVTYVMGPDYFGESKKGALRMLCHDVHQQGGLVLHAGAKEVLFGDDRLTVAILGLSGTGKTTTTFSKQGDRREARCRTTWSCPVARRRALRHRERLLRQDLRPRPPRHEPIHPRAAPARQDRLARERLPGRVAADVRLLQGERSPPKRSSLPPRDPHPHRAPTPTNVDQLHRGARPPVRRGRSTPTACPTTAGTSCSGPATAVQHHSPLRSVD